MPQTKQKLKTLFFRNFKSTLLQIGDFSLEYPLEVYIHTVFLYSLVFSKGDSIGWAY